MAPSTTIPITVFTPLAPFQPISIGANKDSPSDIWYNDNAVTTSNLPVSQQVFIVTTGSNTITTSLGLYWDPGASKIGYLYSVGDHTEGKSTFFPFTATATSTSVTPTSQPSSTEKIPSSEIPVSASPASGSNDANSTPTSTSNPNSTTGTGSPSGSKNGLSGGAVAGVAIGCLLAGALITGLIAFFFIKKKRRPGVRDSEASSAALIHREKGPAVKTMSLESSSPIAGALENGLPLPLEDKAISGEISKISNLIKNHVQSYYHAGRVSPVSIDYDDLQALGDDMPVSVGTLSTLLGNSATRETALRFCIAWIVVSRMQLRSPPSTTFLPPEVSQCVQMMNIGDRGSKLHATYLSRWRAITAELMQSVYVRNPFSSADARIHNLQLAANLLNSVMRPYSDSRMDDGQRSRNLEEILKRSAQFAFTLFSQPSTWDFDWENGQDVKSGSLCIFPALVQVRDDNGEPVKPARPFSEAVIRRLDE